MTPLGRVSAYGDRALRVELGTQDEVLALTAAIREAGWSEVVDVVAAAATVLVVVQVGADLRALAGRIQDVEVEPVPSTTSGEVVTIEVTYDGPDLDSVREHTGLSAPALVAAHCDGPWRVAFAGFAPGFAYLDGGDDRLAVPRLDRPRTSVPAGSVGLAGSYSGIYPRSSPGGWRLIGRTDARLWDIERDPPALLRPGSAVQFVARS